MQLQYFGSVIIENAICVAATTFPQIEKSLLKLFVSLLFTLGLMVNRDAPVSRVRPVVCQHYYGIQAHPASPVQGLTFHSC